MDVMVILLAVSVSGSSVVDGRGFLPPETVVRRAKVGTIGSSAAVVTQVDRL